MLIAVAARAPVATIDMRRAVVVVIVMAVLRRSRDGGEGEGGGQSGQGPATKKLVGHRGIS
jgi:hypothetical protein